MTTAYITGASAGLGRAIARAFAGDGMSVGLIARDRAPLERTAAEIGESAAWAAADVADYGALRDAAESLESQIGPPDIWVNNAMATIFARFADIEPEEFARACNVTFLGGVHGLMIALKLMQPRGHGHMIQIGSALAYRPIPLQAPYCASKLAIRGAVDSLRCELIHDNSPLRLTTVHMPAMNTPQFDWGRRRIAHDPQPVPPIHAPEACAEAVLWATRHPQMREVWVGTSTIAAIVGNKLVPGLMDRKMAGSAYEGQFEKPAQDSDAPGNLFEPVGGLHRIKGRFADREKAKARWIGTSARREVIVLSVLAALVLLIIILAILD